MGNIFILGQIDSLHHSTYLPRRSADDVVSLCRYRSRIGIPKLMSRRRSPSSSTSVPPHTRAELGSSRLTLSSSQEERVNNMTKPPTGEEDETTKPNRRAGRYNARRRHKRSKALEEILFGPSNESRLEVHRARLNRIQLTLYGSEYHAILNPDYAGPTTPRWAAFRLTGVIKPDQLERLEDRLRGLPLGHRSHIAAPSLRSSRARFVRKTKLKDRTLQKRKFIESYDEIFGRKARSLLSKLDPPIGRAMSQYHRRVSRLFTLKEERARKGYCRATKRYKKCHQYLKFRPCKVGTQAKMFRMGGMGTMMRVSSLRQETDWRIAEKDRSKSSPIAERIRLNTSR